MFHRSALGRGDPRHHCPNQIHVGRALTILGRFLGCGPCQIHWRVPRPRGLAGSAVARTRANMVAAGKCSITPSAGWQ
eukprot:8645794-Pyramimonas_sp.AAC.1